MICAIQCFRKPTVQQPACHSESLGTGAHLLRVNSMYKQWATRDERVRAGTSAELTGLACEGFCMSVVDSAGAEVSKKHRQNKEFSQVPTSYSHCERGRQSRETRGTPVPSLDDSRGVNTPPCDTIRALRAAHLRGASLRACRESLDFARGPELVEGPAVRPIGMLFTNAHGS